MYDFCICLFEFHVCSPHGQHLQDWADYRRCFQLASPLSSMTDCHDGHIVFFSRCLPFPHSIYKREELYNSYKVSSFEEQTITLDLNIFVFF